MQQRKTVPENIRDQPVKQIDLKQINEVLQGKSIITGGKNHI